MLRRISSDKSSIKKFYRKASIKSDSQGFQILLDNRILKTPTGTPIILPNPLLALAVASEWETQNVYIKLFTMPLNQLVTTATDLHKSGVKPILLDRIMSFLQTDSICFRDSEDDIIMKPILDHMKTKFGLELPLCLGHLYTGLETPNFSSSVVHEVRNQFEKLDNFHIVALESAASVSKSLSIAESLLSGVIDIPKACFVARIEELRQIETNGLVEGHHDLDQSFTEISLAAAKNLVCLKSI